MTDATVVHVRHHHETCDTKRLESLIRQSHVALSNKLEKLMSLVDEIQVSLEAHKVALDSMKTILRGLDDKLDAAAGDQVKLQKIRDDIRTETQEVLGTLSAAAASDGTQPAGDNAPTE